MLEDFTISSCKVTFEIVEVIFLEYISIKYCGLKLCGSLDFFQNLFDQLRHHVTRRNVEN